MPQPIHTITVQPWDTLGFYERVALDAVTGLLWPLKCEDRLTVLISVLADQIDLIAGDDEQIDAIIDVLRLQLKRSRRQ